MKTYLYRASNLKTTITFMASVNSSPPTNIRKVRDPRKKYETSNTKTIY